MGLVVYGHWGPPLLVFPTSGGDEWEMERQGMIAALADFIDGGRVKIFTCLLSMKSARAAIILCCSISYSSSPFVGKTSSGGF